MTCVSWNECYSSHFPVSVGVFQGSCLAPAFFGVFIDKVIVDCLSSGLGYILAYADDILLICRSVSSLQALLVMIKTSLEDIGLYLNPAKSICLRIGPRVSVPCASVYLGDTPLKWVSTVRYLGVHLASGRLFACDWSPSRRAFNRAANAVVAKLGTRGCREPLLHVLYAKCLPILLYGVEVFKLNKAAANALDFTLCRFVHKILHTGDNCRVQEFLRDNGLPLPSYSACTRRGSFYVKIDNSDNMVSSLIRALNVCKGHNCFRFVMF